ncbi:response regulator receiver domain-containing protein [Novosphingobium sp. PhB165]|uniref:response regulator n=1 Tax=Novosphingobium sp. PhB165 TaxID=2485105 RepID=UPI0010D734D2|nr:response regulator [Novosphingobium sp. PhB165]TCM15364.1 response regulator receiver domain-containing protein [Novosphingobium sp. PhB165]
MNEMVPNWRTRLGAILNPSSTPTALPAQEEIVDNTPVETVLIVDDDVDWCEECAFSLRTMGYAPLVANSAHEAERLYANHDVSIAIVDFNMPGQDGISLIYDLSQSAELRGQRLQFIMVTGYASKDVAIDAMRASAVDFLEKPVQQADLRRALQRTKGLRDTPAARGDLLGKISNLSLELRSLAQLLDEPTARGSGSEGPIGPAQAETADRLERDHEPGELAAYIREILRKESKRREIGGGELFGDPAWEMLLDLLLAKIEGRLVAVSSACIASGAPMSTALRLVRRLVAEGVLFRLPDEHDRRRHFLAINPKLEQPMIGYLSEQLRARKAIANQ